MLTRIDRVQLAVPDRAEAARGWVELLGAEPDGEDEVACLAARRSRYRIGTSFVELLEPAGDGPVADALAERGRGHLFAAGASTPDLDLLVTRLSRVADPVVENGQVHLSAADTGGHGLRLVVSPEEAAGDAAGRVGSLYEVTNLVGDAAAVCADYAERFALDPGTFQPIESDAYGYRGQLTLFAPDALHRFEVIHPHDRDKTMGRFHEKLGDSLYMAFAEVPDLASVEERLAAAGAPHTPVPPPDRRRDDRGPHTVFVHPPALGGMMLGLSRPTYAWSWSGHPEWVDGGL
jgi:hypothetical protein